MAKIIESGVYDNHVHGLENLARLIVESKRPVYVNGSKDVYRNFRLNSALQNCTLGQALAFGLVKQITAIIDIMTNPDSKDGELSTRFADARNYIDLCYVAYSEGQAHEKCLP